MDPVTGETVYDQWFMDRLTAEGNPVAQGTATKRSELRFSKAEIAEALGSVRDAGTIYFMREIAEGAGLLETLAGAIPALWREIFTLACYLVAADKPVMYCDEWVASNEGFDVGSMSSQRISETLAGFGSSERNAFYKLWHAHISEREYVALDITSVSSYSKRIGSCEWGYNRDHEDLPQINICMLFGEKSGLPIYQTVYSGSLKDVSALESTLSEFTALVGKSEITLIMDKGFFSAKNVNMLLGRDGFNGCGFLVPVPFTCGFAKRQIASGRKDIGRLENVVQTSGTPVRGVHKLRAWGNKDVKIHTHVYFDTEKALKEKNELYGHVARLKKLVAEGSDDKRFREDIKRYLIVRKSEKAPHGITISVREDVIASELETTGWFVLISDVIDDAQAALDLYRAKDVVEKSFWRYKNSLGLGRLRVHGDERMENKIFVTFVALILSSRIHTIMKEQMMYKDMTFNKLMLILSKLKSVTVNGTRILRPLTKEQKEIFKAFGVSLPIAD
jgi:transposase